MALADVGFTTCIEVSRCRALARAVAVCFQHISSMYVDALVLEPYPAFFNALSVFRASPPSAAVPLGQTSSGDRAIAAASCSPRVVMILGSCQRTPTQTGIRTLSFTAINFRRSFCLLHRPQQRPSKCRRRAQNTISILQPWASSSRTTVSRPGMAATATFLRMATLT